MICDQCIFGQATESGDPVKKPTGFLTNSTEIAVTLAKRCEGRDGRCGRPAGGYHAPCIGKVAQRAAIYHDQLCEAIRKQRSMEIGVIVGEATMHDGDDCVRELVTQLQDHTDRDEHQISRQEQLRHVITTESNEKWPSVPDDARPGEQLSLIHI